MRKLLNFEPLGNVNSMQSEEFFNYALHTFFNLLNQIELERLEASKY